MFRAVISLAILVMCLAPSASVPAFAADRDIPLQMLSMRDRLLRDRSQYLNQRSDLNSRLNAMRGMQLEIDRLLGSSAVNDEHYRDLLSAKNRLFGAMRDLQRNLDDTEKALINNNQDLSNVEYNIQRFACLR